MMDLIYLIGLLAFVGLIWLLMVIAKWGHETP